VLNGQPILIPDGEGRVLRRIGVRDAEMRSRHLTLRSPRPVPGALGDGGTGLLSSSSPLETTVGPVRAGFSLACPEDSALAPADAGASVLASRRPPPEPVTAVGVVGWGVVAAAVAFGAGKAIPCPFSRA
jgi:hypothetical protein